MALDDLSDKVAITSDITRVSSTGVVVWFGSYQRFIPLLSTNVPSLFTLFLIRERFAYQFEIRSAKAYCLC